MLRSAAHVRQRSPIPPTPTDVPVPTDVPSPTSPALHRQAEAMSYGVPTSPVSMPAAELWLTGPPRSKPAEAEGLGACAPTSPVSVPASEQWLAGPPGAIPVEAPHRRGRRRERSPQAKRQRINSPESVSPISPVYASAAGREVPVEQIQAQHALARGPAPATPLGRKAPGTPTRRGWGAPPTPEGRLPGTPNAGTPTEDVMAPATPDQGRHRLSSAGRASSVDHRSASPAYIVEERGVALPPTPTYTGDSPAYMDDTEPPTPTLEADDDELYSDEIMSFGPATGSRAVPDAPSATWAVRRQPDTPLTAPGVPLAAVLSSMPGVATQGMSSLQLARQLAVIGARFSRPEGPVPGSAPFQPRAHVLPGMESPTPTYDPDEDTDTEDEAAAGSSQAPLLLEGLPSTPQAEVAPPVTASSSTSAAASSFPSTVTTAFPAQDSMPPLASEVFPEQASRRRRLADEETAELPPWKRRVPRKPPP